MKVSKVDNKHPDISISKVDKTLDKLVKVFKDSKLNLKEILLAYGNLGYTIGASIGGYKDKGPSVAQLEYLYATNPSLDVAMMITGLTMTTWIDDLDKSIENIKEELKKEKEEE